jgi:hypothetical protein
VREQRLKTEKLPWSSHLDQCIVNSKSTSRKKV